MTKLLDDAPEAARDLPADDQDSIARVVLRLTGMDDEPPVALTKDERAAIAASKAAAARGEFATDDQVRATWGQTRLVKLRYTLPALADLNSVLDYIAAHSPQGARRVHVRIQSIIDLLLPYPGIGTRTDDPTTRRMTALP